MDADIPFTRSLLRHKEGNLEWAGTPRLRETAQGPFFSVKHSMRVLVTLSYDEGDGKPASSSFLTFALPLRFVRLRGAARACSPHPCSRVSSSDGPALPTTMPPSQPYCAPELPAYSQLFYSNGDVRHDDSIPLPLYTPSPEPLTT
jgi:hypothetical protein